MQNSVQCVWETIRPRDNEVPWYDLVWFSSCIPRHAVHMWLIKKKRLKTQDALSSWDVVAGLTVVCPLYETQPDSHEHLFFDCPFSQQIWSHVKHNAGLSVLGSSLDSIVSILMLIANRKSFKSCIGKLTLAAVAYFVWQELTKYVQSMSSSVTPMRRYGNPASGINILSVLLLHHSELSHSSIDPSRVVDAVELSPTSYLYVRAVRHNLLRGGNSASEVSSLRSTGDGMDSEAGNGGSGDNGNDVGIGSGKCSDDGRGGSGGEGICGSEDDSGVSGDGGEIGKARSLLTSVSDGNGTGV
nr:hypothetical protein [Tanacetum cinerariifolium]